MDTKKIFLLFVMGIFLISMVSAILETKNFDPNKKNHGEIQIDEWLGISNKADYRLLDYKADVFDVWAEGEYKLYKKTHLFQGVFFKDIKGQIGQLKDVKFYIWKNENTTYYDPVYSENCWLDYTNSTFGDQVCERVDTGETTERVEDTSHWIEYQKDTYLEESEGRWRMEAKRPKNKKIDFVLQAHGKTFDEWAWFNETWQLKKLVTVNFTNSTVDLSEYWVELDIPFETGKMASDWSDLRIVNLDENATHVYKYSTKNSTNLHAFIFAQTGIGTIQEGVFQFYIYYNTTTPVNYGWNNTFYYGDTFTNRTSLDWEIGLTNEGTITLDTASSSAYLDSGGSAGGSSIYKNLPSSVADWSDITIHFNGTYSGACTGNDGSYYYAGVTATGSNPTDTWIGFFLDGSVGFGNDNVANLWGNDQVSTQQTSGVICNNWIESDIVQTGNSKTSSVARTQKADWSGTGVTAGSFTSTTGSYQFTSSPALHWYGNGRFSGNDPKLSYLLISHGNGTIDDYAFGDEQLADEDPTVTLNTPANDYDQVSPNFNFNCTATDDSAIANVSLVINGEVVQTNTSGIRGDYLFSYSVTEGAGQYNWSCKAFDDADKTTTATPRNFTYSNQLLIVLNSPVDTYNTTSSTVTFNATPSDDTAVINASLFIDGVLNETNTTGLNNTPIVISKIIADGDHNWTFEACDIYACATATTRTFTVDTTYPLISGTGNLTDLNLFSLPINSTWNFTVADTHLDQCWYSTDGGATNISITCNAYTNTTWVTQGNKSLTYCANDTFGLETCATSYIWVYLLSYTQNDTPDPVAEGFNAVFNLTVNRTNIPSTTATLILNNTVYTATSTASTNSYFFTRTVTIPDTWGNATGILQDWYWNYTIDGVLTNQNTNTSNITVYELAIDDCSTYGEVILDMNLLDEETKTAVNESAGANFEIDLQLTSKTNSDVYVQYNNTWTNENNPQVCIPVNVLNNSEYWIDFTIGFQATDHVWEFFYLDDGTLNSTKVFNSLTSTPLNVYDLLTADSTSFLFNYFDQDGLPVEDVIVHVFRKYIGDGDFKEVERSKADLNGDTIVHLVEEDVIYYFVISQYGEILFTSSQYTALCQSTPCEIQLEASSSGAVFDTDWDLIDGGAYTLQDDPSTRVVNLSYSLNDTSTMNLTIYKYNSDGSYSAVASGSDTGTAGSVVVTVPQSAGNVSFFATVYQDDGFVNSEWVDFEGKAQDRFGITLALFIGALIILSLGLMAITEGVGTLVFVILGVALSGFLGLITTTLSTGVNIVIYLVVAGGILLWKLTGGRR